MAVREIRRVVDPKLKVVAITLEDGFGSRHVVQQRLVYDPAELSAHDYTDTEGREGNLLLDWDEAIVEDAAFSMEQRCKVFCQVMKKRGLLPEADSGETDPLAGYEGCCG